MNKYVYETVDRTFRDIMKKVDPDLEKIPFGGKVFVFGGDFRQILPIVTHGNRASFVSSCMNRSFLWKYVKVFKLTINMRVKENYSNHEKDQFDFDEYFYKIGEGKTQIIKSVAGMVRCKTTTTLTTNFFFLEIWISSLFIRLLFENFIKNA